MLSVQYLYVLDSSEHAQLRRVPPQGKIHCFLPVNSKVVVLASLLKALKCHTCFPAILHLKFSLCYPTVVFKMKAILLHSLVD